MLQAGGDGEFGGAARVGFELPARAAAQLRAVAAAERVTLAAVDTVDDLELVAAAAGGRLLQLACGGAPLSALAGYGPPVVAALSRVLLRAAGWRHGAADDAVVEAVAAAGAAAPGLQLAGQVDALFEQAAAAGFDRAAVAGRVVADLAGGVVDADGLAGGQLPAVVAAVVSYLELREAPAAV